VKSFGRRSRVEAWLEGRPTDVQDILSRWPPGRSTEVEGREAWVVGAVEVRGGPPGLWLSYTDPSVDYASAVFSKFMVHQECLPGECDPSLR
jgi:hypothetical protein